MKRRNRSLSTGEIAVMAVLMLCLVLAITVTAIRSASRKTQDDGEQFVALEESSETEDLAQAEESTAGNAGGRTQTTDGRDEAAASGENKSTPDKFAVKTAQEEMDLIAAEDQETTQLDLDTENAGTGTGHVADRDVADAAGPDGGENLAEQVQETSGSVSQTLPAAETFDFQAQDHLAWPISGNVVLDYSMDGTIYFPTLKQYRYNPAIVISGAVGTPVTAAADGKVTDVSVHAETGTTVTVDLGGGYTAIYGQLKEVPVKEGSVLSAGDLVGYVSEPTKYYSTEGSNLYFALQKDGVPTDPVEYLQ